MIEAVALVLYRSGIWGLLAVLLGVVVLFLATRARTRASIASLAVLSVVPLGIGWLGYAGAAYATWSKMELLGAAMTLKDGSSIVWRPEVLAACAVAGVLLGWGGLLFAAIRRRRGSAVEGAC